MIKSLLVKIIELLSRLIDLAILLLDEELRPLIGELREYIRERRAVSARQQTPVAPGPEEPTYNRFGAAIYLNKSERSVTRWRKEGKLKYVMEGKEIRYPESVLDAFYLKIWCFPKKKHK